MNKKMIIWTTILGTFICTSFALLFFGGHFTDVMRPPIYFLVLGFAGSLSLALFKQKKVRDVLYINVLIYFFFAIFILTVMRPMTAIILFFYYTAMVLAVYSYSKYFAKKLAHFYIAKILTIAAIMGVAFIFANFFHGLLFISRFTPRFLLGNLPIGFLLGLGYGLALVLTEKYVKN